VKGQHVDSPIQYSTWHTLTVGVPTDNYDSDHNSGLVTRLDKRVSPCCGMERDPVVGVCRKLNDSRQERICEAGRGVT
jgi:hypothetical protein